MAPRYLRPPPSSSRGLALLLAAAAALALSLAPQQAAARRTEYVYHTDGLGISRQLPVDRYPVLYTGDFGDCLPGGSLFNVTRFDAGFYADNTTLVFHLHGTSNIKEENLMMHLSIDAYGQSRFSTTLDPCSANTNIPSLCPLNASVPIRAWAPFRIPPAQAEAVPRLAYAMPDLDGAARVRIFANSTRREIGCFQASLTNGVSLSQPRAVAPVLATVLLVAIAASFLSAAYGVSVPHMRTHFAHSLPVLLVAEAFQTVFLSGALSVDWPPILPAWWSNFAWSAGQIYAGGLVRSMGGFAGIEGGDAGHVGGAGSVVINNQGGAFSAAQIYGRSSSLLPLLGGEGASSGGGMAPLGKRQPYNEDDPYDYTWAGDPRGSGMALPGTSFGFPGTLAAVGIPAAGAFTVGLIWFLVAVASVALLTVALKLLLEGLARARWIEDDRLGYFRSHYLGYAAHAVLRAVYIGFFTLATLATFQLTLGGPAPVTVVAALVLVLLLVGMGGQVAHACYCRVRSGKYTIEKDRIVARRVTLFRAIPCVLPTRTSTLESRQGRLAETPSSRPPWWSLPFFRLRHEEGEEERPTVHLDARYIKRFGWLSARNRRTRWWFFAYYLLYQLVRASLVGGGARSPLGQVYGVFTLEVISCLAVARLNPFEGARNSALGVWMLGASKVVTAGLSMAFLPELSLARFPATVVGTVIVAVQALLVAGVVVLVLLSVLSTCMSLSRNRPSPVRPKLLDYVRPYYFESIQAKAEDRPRPPQVSARRPEEMPAATTATATVEKKSSSSSGSGSGPHLPSSPESGPRASSEGRGGAATTSFRVQSVRRNPKIEDEEGVEEGEGGDIVADMDLGGALAAGTGLPGRPKRTASVSSRYSTSSLRAAAAAAAAAGDGGASSGSGSHPRRTSWSSRDFALWDASMTSLEQQQQQQQQSSAPRPGSALAQHRLSPLPAVVTSGAVRSPPRTGGPSSAAATSTAASTENSSSGSKELPLPPPAAAPSVKARASDGEGSLRQRFVTPPTSPTPVLAVPPPALPPPTPSRETLERHSDERSLKMPNPTP